MNQELRTLDCGHEVPPDEVVSVPEVMICRECYAPFDLGDYPDVLDTDKAFAGVNYHGTAEYVTFGTHLIGLDRYGRGVYHREITKEVLYVGPMNDHNFDVPDDAEPLRERHTKPEPAPAPYNPPFHTLPNGDHLTIIDREAVDEGLYPGKGLADWCIGNLAENEEGPTALVAITERMANILSSHGGKDSISAVEVV